MLALIRINLIGRPGAGKKGGARRGLQLPDVPNVGLLLFALFLVIEGAVFFQWQLNSSEEATRATSRLTLRRKEIAELQKIKEEITKTTEEVKKLDAQKVVFDVLLAERSGPVGALHYLSFMLQPRAEAETAADELKAMEAAGWRVAWDARKAWITGFRETDGEVTLTGEALGHEDVAEVQRRLESSAYFRDPKLVFQEKKRDDKLGIFYVEFSIRASLVYLVEPKNPEEPATAAEGDPAAAPGADPSLAGAGAATPTEGAEVIGAKAAIPSADGGPSTDLDGGATGSDAADGDAIAPDSSALDADADAKATDAKTADADEPDAKAAQPDVKGAEPAKEAAPAPAAKAAPPVEKAPLPSAQPSAPPPAEQAADKLPAAE